MRYFYIFIITLIFISFEKDGYAKMENTHNNYTLIVMLGDQLLDNNLHFKDKEKCKYFLEIGRFKKSSFFDENLKFSKIYKKILNDSNFANLFE